MSSIEEFRKTYSTNNMDATRLEPYVTPFILRRKTLDVRSDLQKNYYRLTGEMDEIAKQEYEDIRLEYNGKLNK